MRETIRQSDHAALDYTGTAWQLKLRTRTARERMAAYLGSDGPARHEFTDPFAAVDAWNIVHWPDDDAATTPDRRARRLAAERSMRVRCRVLLAAGGAGTSREDAAERGTTGVPGASHTEGISAVSLGVKRGHLEDIGDDRVRLTPAGRKAVAG